MPKSLVRILFLFLACLLAFEVFLSMKKIEPYPAFFYPAFSKVDPSAEKIAVTKPVFTATFANGETRQMDYYRLFDNIPHSHVNHLVVNNLNPKRRIRPEAFQDKPFRQFQLGRHTVEWRRIPMVPAEEERKQFLRDRIAATTGAPSPATRLDIVWHTYDYYLGAGLDRSSAVRAYEATFNLIPEQQP